MRYSRILGVGSYVPPRVVTNNDLATVLDTSDEWIQQRTGIKQRHWVEENVATSDLAFEASNRALQAAQAKKEEIDMIILATLSPDHEFPGTACFLQSKLGLGGIPAIDLRQQCTGFIYGMSVADQFLKTGAAKKVLVVGSEVHSKGLDKTTRGRDVTVLFGDGAGAIVMDSCEGEESIAVSDKRPRLLSTHLHADGKFAKELWTQAPGFGYIGKERITAEIMERAEHYPKMNGKLVFTHAVKRMPEAVQEALDFNGIKIGDVDLFLFHQANLRINEMVAQQLGIPAEKVFNTIDRFGNTTAATIPLGMTEAIRAEKLKPGMLVMSAAFGSGFTWASALFRY